VPEIAPASAPGKAGKSRLLAGPVISLTSKISSESDELLGGNARSKITDAVATKVLVNGEALPVPAGRADVGSAAMVLDDEIIGLRSRLDRLQRSLRFIDEPVALIKGVIADMEARIAAVESDRRQRTGGGVKAP
jgi:hypothetical protein